MGRYNVSRTFEIQPAISRSTLQKKDCGIKKIRAATVCFVCSGGLMNTDLDPVLEEACEFSNQD